MSYTNEPLRLIRQHGHWALEVTKLVAVDQHVLRPERRRVNGSESVMRHLKERCAAALVRETLDLLVGHDEGDCAYSLEGEHWIQLDEGHGSDAAASSHAKLAATLADVRAELTTLRALHEAMRGRVAALERRALSPVVADHGRAALRAAPRHEALTSAQRPGARSRSLHPPETAAPSPATSPARAELAAAPTQAAAPPTLTAASPAQIAEPPRKPPLAMPTHADVATCLKQLLGTDAELGFERGALPSDLDAFYVSRVVDSAELEVGAILLDLRGGVELAGRLLGLPPPAIEEQTKSEPSTDMLDAMNEVSNNLGGFINRANPDLRVRVRPLEKFSSAELGWLPKHSARVGSTTKLGGRLWLAAR